MDPNPATATTGFIESVISIGDDSDERVTFKGGADGINHGGYNSRGRIGATPRCYTRLNQ